MRVYREIDFNDLQNMVWSGATDTVENIANANMQDELMGLLEEMFIWYNENVPTETEINDFLWFDDEYIYKTLGLNEDGEVDDEETDNEELFEKTIDRIKYRDSFEAFCEGCEDCALNDMAGTVIQCEMVYNAYKNGEMTTEEIKERLV